MKKTNGFTLVELLVVGVILSFFALVVLVIGGGIFYLVR